MAAQQGFVYEENAAKVLKEYGIVPRDFKPAGAGHDQPDLIVQDKNKKSGCELKITAASAGSLVIKYNNKQKKWGFGDIKTDDDEKMFIRDLAYEVGLIDLINRQWKDVPYQRERDDLWKATAGKLQPRERYERDLKTFKEIKGPIPATKIEQYYNHKKTYYVNVGTHGFYLLGGVNPLRLKNVPKFSDCAAASYRARVQYKGNGNHQFTFEMAFGVRTKSEFNIAPVDGKTVNIIKDKMNLSCFNI